MTTPWIGASLEGVRARKWFPQTESDVVVAGQRARRTANFALEFAGGFTSGGLSAEKQRVTGDFSLSAQTPTVLLGVLPRRTASFVVLPWAYAELSGTRSRVTASFQVESSEAALLDGVRQRRSANFRILPWSIGQLQGERARRTASFTIVPGALKAFVDFNAYRMRRTASISLKPYASVTSLEAVRRRRLSQIEMDVSNDSPEDLAGAGSIIRWTFRGDDGQFARVPINPREMTTPTEPRNMSWAWGAAPGAAMRGVDLGSDQPAQWSFTGVLLTKAHYDLLSAWTRGLATVQITDHLNRTFETIIQRFDPIERLPTASREWRADYTMTCLLLRRVA